MFSEFILQAEQYYARNRHWSRRGQAYMNTLREYDSVIYQKIMGDREADPFYEDDKIPAFLEYVENNLKG